LYCIDYHHKQHMQLEAAKHHWCLSMSNTISACSGSPSYATSIRMLHSRLQQHMNTALARAQPQYN